MAIREPTDLEAGLAAIRASPRGSGTVELIVRRPGIDEREQVEEAALDVVEGLVGDGWRARGSSATPDRTADLEAQLTLMNARVARLLAGDRDRWGLAGDQLYVDLDLSIDHLPPGSRLAVGSAVIEVSATPHTGCSKFSGRFGIDALAFISTPTGKALRMRGVNTRVVSSGTVRTGDVIRKLGPTPT
jgi:MOSC domain-containing protein YiiM